MKSESDLKAILAAQKADALSGEVVSKLASERTDAMDYYMGDVSKDMPSVDGRSKAVSTDVSDTVEGLMPALMEIFCGSDEVVKFAPVGPEDVDAAAQETDYVNHVFMQKNPGFLILYSFIKDALLSKVGIVKVYGDEGETEERETYYDQPDDAFAMIMQKPGVEIVKYSQNENGLHDVEIVCKKPYSDSCVEPVPPEEFGISRYAKNIRDAGYCYHEVRRTESDLIADGFDKEQIKKLPSYATPAKTEEQSRDTVDETVDRGGDDSLNTALRLILVTEHYTKLDYEEDGKVRLYRITTGGGQGEVLKRDGEPDVVEVDMIPFAAMTPVIMTHRFFGRSIADMVMDIMRIKTALLRALLDNAYLANNPRAVVSEEDANENTIDDLLVSRPGNIARVRRNAAGAIAWQMVPTIGNHIYPLLEYQDMAREMRTGVTRQGQGIDADALQNQSATAVNQLYSAAQARIKLIARIFAETGIKDLFWLLHATIRKYGKQAETVQLRNKWVPVDPRQWKTRNDLTINVGLGSGGKSEQIQQLMVMMNIQKEIIAGGMTEVVNAKNIYNSTKEITKLLEKKNHEDFFTDPESEQGQMAAQNKPPPPEVIKMNMQAQLEEKSDIRKAEIEKIQALADIETTNKKTEAEIAQNEREFQLEARLKILEHNLKEREAEIKATAQTQSHEMKMREGEAKAEQAKPKEDSANQMATVAKQFADIMAQSTAAQEKTNKELIAAISEKIKRKTIKTPGGKVYEMTEE